MFQGGGKVRTSRITQSIKNQSRLKSMRAASHENQISYSSYCQLGGCLNTDLTKVHRRNGSYEYFTYHHVGYGQAYWKIN